MDLKQNQKRRTSPTTGHVSNVLRMGINEDVSDSFWQKMKRKEAGTKSSSYFMNLLFLAFSKLKDTLTPCT